MSKFSIKLDKLKIKGQDLIDSMRFREQTAKVENTIYKISPKGGKIVKVVNDIGDTVMNPIVSNPVTRIIKDSQPEGAWDYVLADHLYVYRLGYSHHAIYVGNGHVLHYSDGIIHEATLLEFSQGAKIYVKKSPLIHDVNYAVWRGYKRKNECEYNLIINNCEHFVRWCRSGSGNY